jgi:hypothetical protein
MASCYCLIPHASTPRVLLTRAGGGWTLPTVDHAEDWFAHEACSVAREMGKRLGLTLTALREIEQAGVRICELENHSPGWSAPPQARWVAGTDLTALNLVPPSQRRPLDAWFRQSVRKRPPAGRSPWEQKGWFGEALTWIQQQLARLGYTSAGPVQQFKTAWSCSAILRVPTTNGELWFKAMYARPPSEVAVIKELARHWPRHVPRLLAVDHARRWMLMEDFGNCRLAPSPLARWQSALRCFARIQQQCSTNLGPWFNMGCPDRRMEQLSQYLEPLFADPLLQRADPSDRLSRQEIRQLQAKRRRFARKCLDLARSPLPVSIVQQDFREGNIAIRGRRYLYYDWSDTVLSHPFFSACRFLDYVHGTEDSPRHKRGPKQTIATVHDRLRDAYLQPWAPYASQDRLREVFRLAQRLNPLYLAIRWHLELPYCEVGSPWWRGMLSSVTWELKRLLQNWNCRVQPPCG